MKINQRGMAPVIIIIIAGAILGAVTIFLTYKSTTQPVITNYVPSPDSTQSSATPSAIPKTTAKPSTKSPTPSPKPTSTPLTSSSPNPSSSSSSESNSSSTSSTPSPSSTPTPSQSSDQISVDKTSFSVTLSRANGNSGYMSTAGVKVTSNGATGFNFSNDQGQSGVGLSYSSQGMNVGSTVGVDAFITGDHPNGVYTGTNTLHYTYNNQRFVGPVVSYTITLTD